MSAKSRDKGIRGELEVRDLLRKYGFEAERGQQHSGSPDSPDVKHNIPGFHIEVKRTEAFNLYDAFWQATEDDAFRLPAVFHRRNRQPWVVVLEAETFLEIMKERQLGPTPNA